MFYNYIKIILKYNMKTLNIISLSVCVQKNDSFLFYYENY